MIYFVQAEIGGPVKIGHTAGEDCSKRLSELQCGCPFRLRVLATMDGGPPEEREMHRRFAHLREHGEWFRLDRELRALIGARCAPVQPRVTIAPLELPPAVPYGPLAERDQAIVDAVAALDGRSQRPEEERWFRAAEIAGEMREPPRISTVGIQASRLVARWGRLDKRLRKRWDWRGDLLRPVAEYALVRGGRPRATVQDETRPGLSDYRRRIERAKRRLGTAAAAVVLAALLLAAAVLAAPAPAQAGWRIDRAAAIARVVWHHPCVDRMQLRWGSQPPEFAYAALAWADVESCTVTFNAAVHLEWGDVCYELLHEAGHLAGYRHPVGVEPWGGPRDAPRDHDHSPDPRSVMYPSPPIVETDGHIPPYADERCVRRGRPYLEAHGLLSAPTGESGHGPD